MSKGALVKICETIELMKISNEKYRYVNPSFNKPTAKLSDHTADIKLKVGNEYFKAHKDVLSLASDYFSAMFSHNMVEKDKDYIELGGISSGGFQVMLEYFYHGYITLVLENVRHCLEASRFFHVEWLTKVCCNYLMRHLSVDNCVRIFSLVDAFSLMDLVEDLYNFIGLNAIELMNNEQALSLPYEVIFHLISADYYINLDEEMVLKLLIDWANVDFKSRESQLSELLTHVKFHLLAPEELDNIPPPLLNYKGVRGQVERARAIWKAPHRWSILDGDLSGRGGREVLVLISEWNQDKMRLIDLNNPHAHEEYFGLINEETLADFSSMACLGDFLYCAGGYDTQLLPISSLLFYDPRMRHWAQMPPMSQSRENFPLVVMSGKLYALGGSGGTVRQPAEGEIASENEAVIGEFLEPITLETCECYSPEDNRWTSVPALPYGMFSHAACALNGTLYVTGGITSNLSDPVPVGYCYSWTPGDAVWTRRASMLTRRQSHAMFSYNNKIYVLGGYTAGDLQDLSLSMVNCLKNECYDPVKDIWVALMDTPEEFGHIHRTMVIIDDVAYLLGSVHSSRYLHEFHLANEELVQGAFCGKDFVKLIKLTMYYPRFIPNEINSSNQECSEQPALDSLPLDSLTK